MWNKVISNSKKNYKLLIIFLTVIVSLFGLFQFYLYNENSNILNTSVEYNNVKDSLNNNDFNEIFESISKEKNFYGVLANLENINIKLIKNETQSAYSDYIFLIKQKKLPDLYSSAIAVHASYKLIDKIDFKLLKKNHLLLSSTDIYNNINNLISLIDDKILSYEGIKYEIQFLLSIIEQEYNEDTVLSDITIGIYEKIQSSTSITSSLKERVKKIYEKKKNK